MASQIEFNNAEGKVLVLSSGKTLTLQKLDKTMVVNVGGKQGVPGPPGDLGDDFSIDCGTF